MKKLFTLLIALVIMVGNMAYAQTLTFSMANAMISGTAPNQTLEFDVLVECDQAGILHESGLFYMNYNTTAFGSSASFNGAATASPGTLIPFPKYFLLTLQDNTPSRLAQSYLPAANPLAPFNAANYEAVPTTPTSIWHVELDIANIAQNAGLTFDQASMAGQFFYINSGGSSAFTLAYGADYSTLNLSNIPQLPLEGLSLTASPQETSIDLAWTIDREVSNKGFFVERATDGENYTELGWVEGAGDAVNTRYEFSDKTAAANQTYHYRLRQVDLDGEVHLSPVIQSRINSSADLYAQVAPNPVVGPDAIVKLSTPVGGEVNYSVSDNVGRIVMSGTWNTEKGTHNQSLIVSEMAAGAYQLRVSDGLRSSTTSMIIQK
ncbi:MAG: T9SS type A sorting domain-containing protein [Bacteroidia bacterium]